MTKETITIPTGVFGDVPVECEIVGRLAIHPVFIPGIEENTFTFSPHWYAVAHPKTGCRFGYDDWRLDQAKALALALSAVPGIEALDRISDPRKRLVTQGKTLVKVKDVLSPDVFATIKKILAEHRAMQEREYSEVAP